MTSSPSDKEQNTNYNVGPHSAHRAIPKVGIATAAPIARLNDAFRRSFSGGRVVMSAGVAALPSVARAALLAAVRGFDRFDADNDPHGEHDFGMVTVAGYRCYWKFDAHHRDLCRHSPDPADPAVTIRVLTLMLAERY